MWAEKFKGLCVVKGCVSVLLQDLPIPKDDEFVDCELDPLSETPDTDKKAIQLKKKNQLAWSLLTICIQDKSTFGLMNSAKPEGYTEGHARSAWLAIETRFKPKSDANKYELENKFHHCALINENKSPDDWFADFEEIRTQLRIDFQIDIKDEKMVSHIVYNMKPRMYQNTLEIIKRELNNSVVIKLESLKKDMRQIFNQNSNKTSYLKEKKETVLVAMNVASAKKFPKKFKGDCRICGVKGHKAGDCWENEKNKDKRPPHYKSKQSNKGSNDKPKLKCTYCGKDNHTVDKCFQKQKDDKKSKNDISDIMMVTIENLRLRPSVKDEDKRDEICALIDHEKATGKCVPYSELKLKNTRNGGSKWNRSFGRNTWILDSGATAHMRFSLEGMMDLVPWKSSITVGNKEIIYSEQKGTFKGAIVSDSGVEFYVTMEDVLYVPGIFMNLFSLIKAMLDPRISIERIGKYIALGVGHNNKLIFDKVIDGGNGNLLAVDIFPVYRNNQANKSSISAISHESFHHMLGHPNDGIVKATAQKMGLKIHPKEDVCADCAMAKSKSKKISKLNVSNLATKKGERMMIDIASTKVSSQGGNNYWLLGLDEFTKMKWSFFLKKKSEFWKYITEFCTKSN